MALKVRVLSPFSATFALPLALWLLTSFFQKLPDELYQVLQTFLRPQENAHV